MTPAARVAAAIEVIDLWLIDRHGLDRVLAAWNRANRYAGSGDRHAIADLVYDAVRRFSSSLWLAGTEQPSGRAAIIGSALLDGAAPDDLERIFCGAQYAPAPLEATERAALGRDLCAAPPHVAADVPGWLAAQIAPRELEECALLRTRAAVDLRVNLLKSDLETARATLGEEGVVAVRGPHSGTCLRVVEGARRVRATRCYREGIVEVQDAASQAAADFCAVRPGMSVLDYCAGAGGKALSMAARMGAQGRVIAHDASAARLAQLAPRAARAGARIDLAGSVSDLERCQFDLVLADVPCSGSGAWRRNPDAKWRLEAGAFETLLGRQYAILAAAAQHVRPGGVLVYATCSLFEAERIGPVARFLENDTSFQLDDERLSLNLSDGCDGFSACRLISRV